MKRECKVIDQHASKKRRRKMNLEASKDFMCAIRGYHYHRSHWEPVRSETLKCLHDKENAFDVFAIKTCEAKSFKTVGHLPKEISKATKLMLDRGAVVSATVSSNIFRRSPLGRGGLEIPCKVSVTMPVKNIKTLEKYILTVQKLYIEPEREVMVGSIVFDSFPSDAPKVVATKKTNPKKKQKIISQDIRSCFAAMRKSKKMKIKKKKKKTTLF